MTTVYFSKNTSLMPKRPQGRGREQQASPPAVHWLKRLTNFHLLCRKRRTNRTLCSLCSKATEFLEWNPQAKHLLKCVFLSVSWKQLFGSSFVLSFPCISKFFIVLLYAKQSKLCNDSFNRQTKPDLEKPFCSVVMYFMLLKHALKTLLNVSFGLYGLG